MNSRQMLKELAGAKPVHVHDELVEALGHGELEDAHAWGFSVQNTSGRTEISIPGGLTSSEYERLSPMLDEYGRTTLAIGVLKNTLRTLPWSEWNTAFTLLCNKYGSDECQWLPELVDTLGFDEVAGEIVELLRDYRRLIPPERMKLALDKKPVWTRTQRVLTYASQRWPFRSDAVSVFALLDALEANDWRPTTVNYEFSKLSYAASRINLKTKRCVTFRVATDCLVTWTGF